MSSERAPIDGSIKEAWRTSELDLDVSDPVLCGLERLTKTGLYGDSPQATAELLLCRALREELVFMFPVKGKTK